MLACTWAWPTSVMGPVQAKRGAAPLGLSRSIGAENSGNAVTSFEPAHRSAPGSVLRVKPLRRSVT
jgi:hypothetical protein